jgi:hypothetical protein
MFSFSVNYIVVSSRIFSGIRNFFLVKLPTIGSLISCIQCFGFWTGLSIFALHKIEILKLHGVVFSVSDYLVIDFILLGVASSTFSVLFNSVLVFLNKSDTYIIDKKSP